MKEPRRGKRLFTVTLDVPPHATPEDARAYIEDAITTWCGNLFPGDADNDCDPMWPLDRASVKVAIGRDGVRPGKRGEVRPRLPHVRS